MRAWHIAIPLLAVAAATGVNYTAEMKAASRERCIRLQSLMKELFIEQLAEIDRVLNEL